MAADLLNRAGVLLWRRLTTRRQAREATATLQQKRIYILPTRQGLGFAMLLGVMLLGAINYGNNLAFILTFLLGSQAVISILHTYRNLAGLHLRAGPCAPVFAGDRVRFEVLLENRGTRARPDVALGWQRNERLTVTDVPANGTGLGWLERRSERRGWLRPGRFVVSTRHPLGLFHAWSWVDLDLRALIYPRPLPGPIPGRPAGERSGDQLLSVEGQEDFAALRHYRTGDSLRHVAWKAVARGQPLLTKQFDAPAEERLWLDWESLGGMDTEARLSRLTAGVLEAEEGEQPYGLRIPGLTLAPAHGHAHRDHCLEVLALFGGSS